VRLVVTTQAGISVDVEGVRHVRAEDGTGAFGLLAHHGDLITVLAISVVTWRDESEREHHLAVRGGVLTMTSGELVQVATREAQAGDDLEVLERAVVERYRAEANATAAARREAMRFESAIVRRVLRYIRPTLALPALREEHEP
jgi:F-type H+-transporting ATPase subunit epsilon